MNPNLIQIRSKIRTVFGKVAPLIFGQAVHETGYFRSDIYLNNRNLFGMKLARVRPTTAIGERSGHAVYKSIDDSIRDFELWLIYNKFDFSRDWTAEDYAGWLKLKGYYEDDYANYLKGIKNGLKYA